MIICKNCNYQFENTEFCPNCGTPAVVVPETPIVEQVTDEPVVNQEEVINETTDEVESNDTILIDESIVEEKPAVDPGKNLGIISLILGIASIVGQCCPCIPYSFVTLSICAIVGIILSVNAKNKSIEAGFDNKLAKIAKIISIVGIVVCVIGFIIYIISNILVAFVPAFGEFFSGFADGFYEGYYGY